MLPVEPQKRQRGLLLDKAARHGRDQQPMDVRRERLGHLLASDVGDRMQGETVVDLGRVVEVLADRIDDQADQVRVLVQEERDGEVALIMGKPSRTRKESAVWAS